jgi:glycosyltransferase involved in cell wall biosynthesis
VCGENNKEIMQATYVSIIIPTYNDWHRLATCISALDKQTYPKDSYEVIVINNNPSDEVPDGFTLPDGFQLLTEEKPGSYAARNKGLRVAKGEILGFTDSDCIPDKDWIKNAVMYFAGNESCSRIAGKIDFYFKEERPNDVELLETLFSFNQESYVKVHGMGVTGNMFSRRNVFDAVGDFNGSLMSGGDLEWGSRARIAGYQIHYAPSVIVRHPARSSFEELKSKARRIAGGHAKTAFNKKATIFRHLWKLLIGFKPNVRETIFIYRQKKIRLKSRTNIHLMRYSLQVTQALEKFKVNMGKTPSRF